MSCFNASINMNSACLPNSLMSQPLLPHTGPIPASTATPPNSSSTIATPSMDPHNTSLSGSEAGNEPRQYSSPISKPDNGLRINYEGRVSLLAHAPIYGGGAGDVSTTLDDSREYTDDQLSPKEQSSSPEAMAKSSEDELRPSNDSLERLREICNKSLPMHGNTMIDTASNEQLQPDGSTLFNCHLCTFTTPSREEFNEHVNDHYEFRCPKCEYSTKSEPEYKTHLREEHNLSPEDLDDDQGIRVPKINSQGKVKIFKCKQCEFVAVTKEDFWRHSKSHIKPEKMLNCPKCPFVTEYKHHLEYHLRNHFGSKPFKCPSCSYTCVNKSMLNSHMKSHTNIYQYRCADCNYATKYCHSLKLHLRKYTHKPAMVLNPDGTPNPLPIIDVYGTRRGPKRKTDADGNPIPGAAGLSPEDGGMHPPPSRSPSSPVSHHGLDLAGTPQAPRFPLLPPFVMAQMQMQMQSLTQSSPTRVAQVPPFSRSSNEDFSALSPVRRYNERGDSSEMDEDDRRSLNGDGLKEKLKCAICDFETASNDIYRNHLMLHATKDQDSPPPGTPPISLPQYPLQIRSPLAINAEAKAAAAAAAASLFRSRSSDRPMSSSVESDAESPSSSNIVKAEKSDSPMDYLEYLKKVAPLLKHSMTPSPSGISSTQAQSPHSASTTSELISRLYFGSMVKNLSQHNLQLQKPSQTSGNAPDADSSSGALDLSQLNKGDVDSSNMPSRPQSGSQPSTTGSTSGKSRRKGKAFKIERKMVNTAADDRDSLNSGHSEYSNEHELHDVEVKSDGSSGSGKEPATTTGSNGDNGHHEHEGHVVGGASSMGKRVNLSGSHVCKFCEIAFMDSIMFTIHMGYHGFQNPYKCNMCGEEMDDRVGFFLHIARKAHQ